ncbi:MAG TPA: TlpA disulfide reductase family protein [Chitinophagaceae bacterium]|nr:TlpA disulfide reductase family protein [Chitinophagaceae bacterium]
MNKSLPAVLTWLVFSISIRAQSQSRPLKIGQDCPDVEMKPIINYGKDSARISDFRGKYLILDFWATWCSGCIAMLPREDSLQKEFKGKVEFLPVDYERAGAVQDFLKAYKKRKGIIVPSVAEDTILVKLFPHQLLPHFVWIDTGGKVMAITGSDQICADTVQAVLDGQRILVRKYDISIKVRDSLPFLVNGNGGQCNDLIYHSVITGFMPGINAQMHFDPKDSIKGLKIRCLNVSPLDLINWGFSAGGLEFQKCTTILNVQDSSDFTTGLTGEQNAEWAQDHEFCFELIVPLYMEGQFFDILHSEIRNFIRARFHASVKVEKRMTRAWVLVRTSKVDKIASKGGEPASFFNEAEGAHIRNEYLMVLYEYLRVIYMQNSKYPLVDSADYLKKVDLNLDARLSDMGSVNKALVKYDLQFVLKDAPVDFLVITQDKDSPLEGSKQGSIVHKNL